MIESILKAYTTFIDEQRAKRGKYAAENNDSAALKRQECSVPVTKNALIEIKIVLFLGQTHNFWDCKCY